MNSASPTPLDPPNITLNTFPTKILNTIERNLICINCKKDKPIWKEILIHKSKTCISYYCSCGNHWIPLHSYMEQLYQLKITSIPKKIDNYYGFSNDSEIGEEKINNSLTIKGGTIKNNNNCNILKKLTFLDPQYQQIFESNWSDVGTLQYEKIEKILSLCVEVYDYDFKNIYTELNNAIKNLLSLQKEIELNYKSVRVKMKEEHEFIKLIYHDYQKEKSPLSIHNFNMFSRILPCKCYFGDEKEWIPKCDIYKEHLKKYTIFHFGNKLLHETFKFFYITFKEYPRYKVSNKNYYGDWKCDKRNGIGMISYSDGDFFGNWLNDKKEGFGIYKYKDGSVFKGNFISDIKQGKGEWFNSEGNKYNGEYKNNYIEGYGKFTWNNGDIYKGNFLQGYRHGFGEWFVKSKNEVLKGFWERDKLVKKSH